jgi:putative ABC transport system substrate-binding protein
MSARFVVLGLLPFLAGVLAAAAASAQAPPAPAPAIGILLSGTGDRAFIDVLHKALSERGYLEGRNIRVHERFAANRVDQLPVLAAELESLDVKVIVTTGTTAVRSILAATRVPIVIAGAGDPVATGVAQSLSHPGGRATGLSIMGEEMIGKRLALLREILPEAQLFAGLFNPANPGNTVWKQAMETAAGSLGVQFRSFDVETGDQLGPMFEQVAALKPDGLVLIEDPLFHSHPDRVAELALEHRLPTVVGDIANARAGALLAYAVDRADMWRRAAFYVDRILRGVPAAELPT